ncbi:MAG: sugar phosphate isomerase/epimerase [Phycisphaerales bacterium]|nr:sugar phosphate isomerase/epimerase [Phycisphaerales bacterium]
MFIGDLAMMKLAAFADEISPNLDEQIKVCVANGVEAFELRGVNNLNVLDFDKTLQREIRTKLKDNGLGVASIGSPIGKVKINEPFGAHFDRFKIAVDLADFFEAPFIRIFSYYPADPNDDILKHRDEVLRRMRAKVDYLGDRPVVLVHENEADIYGEKVAQCVDLMKSIDSARLRSAFDFANFVVAGENPLENWPKLKPYTVHIHIKDARKSDKKNVPAGEGDGQIEPILSDLGRSGYRGYLTMEPHLAMAGQFRGHTGPELFKIAVDALRAVANRAGVRV